jgi:hypothetical protein
MILFPFVSFRIETDLSTKEAMTAIILAVRTERGILTSNGSQKSRFHGTLSGSSFKIRRVINYRNSFLPVIRGKIRSAGEGAVISITMNLELSTAIFMILWCSITGFTLLNFFSSEASHGFDWITAALLLAFGYLLATIGFGIEAKKAEKLLMSIFTEAEEKNS